MAARRLVLELIDQTSVERIEPIDIIEKTPRTGRYFALAVDSRDP